MRGLLWKRVGIGGRCGLLAIGVMIACPCLGRGATARRYAGARVVDVSGALGSAPVATKTSWWTPDAMRFIMPDGWGFGAMMQSLHPTKVTFMMIDTRKKEITEVPANALGQFESVLERQDPGITALTKAAIASEQRKAALEHPGPWRTIGSVEYLGLHCRIQRRIFKSGSHWEIQWVARPLIPGMMNPDGALTLFHEEHKPDGTISIDQITSLQLYRKVPAEWFNTPKGYTIIKLPAGGGTPAGPKAALAPSGTPPH